jgi:hypothetical protein
MKIHSISTEWSNDGKGLDVTVHYKISHDALAELDRQAAFRCAQIASDLAESYGKQDGFPSHHAVGAERYVSLFQKLARVEAAPS